MKQILLDWKQDRFSIGSVVLYVLAVLWYVGFSGEAEALELTYSYVGPQLQFTSSSFVNYFGLPTTQCPATVGNITASVTLGTQGVIPSVSILDGSVSGLAWVCINYHTTYANNAYLTGEITGAEISAPNLQATIDGTTVGLSVSICYAPNPVSFGCGGDGVLFNPESVLTSS